MTPLNLAKMINVIASGGFLMEPRLVMEVDPGDGEPPRSYAQSYPVRVIQSSTAEEVKSNDAKRHFKRGLEKFKPPKSRSRRKNRNIRNGGMFGSEVFSLQRNHATLSLFWWKTDRPSGGTEVHILKENMRLSQ